ncbi:hypothetical protein BDV23DRAFT_153270 [Aspergillus alliaceus]|uniref:Uncharacterized protein n=1 Tax=Petromyces alliaceus TaxID=209559 RepID=A0A5N7CCI0_PETAA|nr:hypothetical protein BDV23DRAFT_153270 [Aspergillus alliaceus]
METRQASCIGFGVIIGFWRTDWWSGSNPGCWRLGIVVLSCLFIIIISGGRIRWPWNGH